MRCLVTGGGGFVGKALCKRLRADGHEVISLSRGSYPELDALGVKTIKFDLSGPAPDAELLKGVDTVFHTAAKVDMWGRYQDFYLTNVLGTRNLLEAAQKADVKKFVFTSSPSVIANGKDHKGSDESLRYPSTFMAYYPRTKAMSEGEVLKANSSTFYTIALRPHLIFGPGDNHFVPTILEKARRGLLKRVGNGKNLVDFSFIDDCVEAHVAAAKALDNVPESRGRAFFISQGEATPLWGWINEVLAYNNLPPVKGSIPHWIADKLALILEWAAYVIPGSKEPRLTRFLASQMATSHYFNIGAAKRFLGYTPKYPMQDAMEITFRNGPASDAKLAM